MQESKIRPALLACLEAEAHRAIVSRELASLRRAYETVAREDGFAPFDSDPSTEAEIERLERAADRAEGRFAETCRALYSAIKSTMPEAPTKEAPARALVSR